VQVAVAPVFLLTALGTFLAVLNARLGRVVDRARVILDRLSTLSEAARPPLREELQLLLRRRRLVNRAITFGTVAALLVCVLIASSFLGAIMKFNVSNVVATLFVGAMLAFVVALLLFLREVLLATWAVHWEAR